MVARLDYTRQGASAPPDIRSTRCALHVSDNQFFGGRMHFLNGPAAFSYLLTRPNIEAAMGSLPQHSSDRELQQFTSPSPASQPLLGRNLQDLSPTPANTDQEFLGWTPFFLRKRTLVGLSSGFLLILLAIVALAVTDANHNGISSADESVHYLWTYGTTAGMYPNFLSISV